MRVSDLLNREPFGEVLEQTLASYWSAVTGNLVEVFWGSGSRGSQEWRGNPYLNFFCTSDVERVCFDNIIREFGYARSWWRRGLQAGYVRAAVTPPSRDWLSRLRFRVSVPIQDSGHQIVIGGRNRLRILHPREGESVVIAKVMAPRLEFEREVSVRSGLAAEIAPRYFGVRANGLAFAEEYFVGTPANRLPRSRALWARQEASMRLIEAVHRPSIRCVSIFEYLEQLSGAIKQLSIVAGAEAQALADLAARMSGSESLGVAMTHGDFQQGNILVTENDLRVIDWETATERSQLYDLATLSSGIRLARSRFQTWRRALDLWMKCPAHVPSLLVPAQGKRCLLGHATVWWLEEAIFLLEDARAGFQTDTAASDQVVSADLKQARHYLQTVSL